MENDNELKNSILNGYQELIKIAIKNNKTSTKEVTVCPTIRGSEPKIMFVGRSINGWCNIIQNGEDKTLQQLKVCRQIGLDWFVNPDTYANCTKLGCPLAKQQNCPLAKVKQAKAPISKSKFLKFIRYVCKQNNIDVSNNDWVNNIAWSNLYKMSYVNGGNPKRLYDVQKEICDNLLQNEIKYIKPKAICFITERKKNPNTYDSRTWFSPTDFKQTYNYLKNNQIDTYITIRPERTAFDRVFSEKRQLTYNGTKG